MGVLSSTIEYSISIKCPKFIKTVAFLLVIWILISLTTYHVWIHGANHRDFYPRWAGSRIVLEGSKDLYSVEATRDIQLRLYQGEIPLHQDQQGFAYPAYLLPLLLPFGLIGDVEVSTAIWVGFSFILLLLSFILLQHQRGHPISMLPVLLFILWFYPLLMIFQAQMTGLILASLGIGFWAYRERKDCLAGFLLSISFIKPNLVIVPICTFLVLGILDKRFKFLLFFLFSSLIFFLTSFLLVGWWIPDWLEAIRRYSEYAKVTWALDSIWNVNPVLCLLFISIVLTMFFKVRDDVEVCFASSIPVQMLLFPQTLVYGLTMLCLPLMVCWRRRAHFAVVFTWLLGWGMLLFNARFGLWDVELILMSFLSLMVLSTIDKSRGIRISRLSLFRKKDVGSFPLWDIKAKGV